MSKYSLLCTILVSQPLPLEDLRCQFRGNRPFPMGPWRRLRAGGRPTAEFQVFHSLIAMWSRSPRARPAHILHCLLKRGLPILAHDGRAGQKYNGTHTPREHPPVAATTRNSPPTVRRLMPTGPGSILEGMAAASALPVASPRSMKAG